MGILKSLWTVLTASKGIKRNVGIAMIFLAVVAGKLGIDLPSDMETQVEEFLKWIGGGIAFWGVLANLYQQWKTKKDAKLKAKVTAGSELLKTASASLRNLSVIIGVIVVSGILFSAMAESPFSHFLKARTPAEFKQPKVWEFKASAVLPAARLTVSRVTDRVLDVEYLPNAGAGLTYQAVILKDEKPFALYGVSVIMLKDLTAGLLFNFWNNTFGIGPGYTFGQIVDYNKRPCIMFTMQYTFFQ